MARPTSDPYGKWNDPNATKLGTGTYRRGPSASTAKKPIATGILADKERAYRKNAEMDPARYRDKQKGFARSLASQSVTARARKR